MIIHAGINHLPLKAKTGFINCGAIVRTPVKLIESLNKILNDKKIEILAYVCL